MAVCLYLGYFGINIWKTHNGMHEKNTERRQSSLYSFLETLIVLRQRYRKPCVCVPAFILYRGRKGSTWILKYSQYVNRNVCVLRMYGTGPSSGMFKPQSPHNPQRALYFRWFAIFFVPQDLKYCLINRAPSKHLKHMSLCIKVCDIYCQSFHN